MEKNMSMRPWTENGYGYPLFNGTPENLDAVKKCIIDNAEGPEKDKLNEYLADIADKYEIEEVVGNCPAYNVAECLNKQLNINCIAGFASCADTGQDMMIGIVGSYP